LPTNSALHKKTTKQLLEILIYEKSKFEKEAFQEVKEIYKSRGVLWPEEKELRKQLKKERREAAKAKSKKGWRPYSLWDFGLEILSLLFRLFTI